MHVCQLCFYVFIEKLLYRILCTRVKCIYVYIFSPYGILIVNYFETVHNP